VFRARRATLVILLEIANFRKEMKYMDYSIRFKPNGTSLVASRRIPKRKVGTKTNG
jgi:hypothetical protein